MPGWMTLPGDDPYFRGRIIQSFLEEDQSEDRLEKLERDFYQFRDGTQASMSQLQEMLIGLNTYLDSVGGNVLPNLQEIKKRIKQALAVSQGCDPKQLDEMEHEMHEIHNRSVEAVVANKAAQKTSQRAMRAIDQVTTTLANQQDQMDGLQQYLDDLDYAIHGE